MKRILVMGAHFDDFEIGVGGTLVKHISNGDMVYLCVICADEFRTGDPTRRVKEQLDVLDHLNLTETNLILFNLDDIDADIINVLDSLNPDIIYTSYEDDTHQHHRRCSKIGQSVGRKPNVTTLFYGGASVRNFMPNVFISVDERQKKNLLEVYKSQIECGAINIDRVLKREKYWGTMISKDPNSYAEGFVVHKMEIKIDD